MAAAALVIVNYRTSDETAHCLDLVGDAGLEVVVVDNASGDGSAERLRERHPQATVAEQPDNRGFGAGVNAGFALTRAPYVIVLNPDTEPRPGALTRLLEYLDAHPRAGVVAPRLLHPDGSPQRNAHKRFPNLWTLFVDFCVPLGYLLARWPDRHPHELLEAAGPVAHVNGSAMAIRRAAFDAAGGFDEAFFMYLEETEFQQRVARAGWTIDVEPRAEVAHAARGGAGMAAITERYLPSIYRYQRLQGRPAWQVSAVLAAGSLLSVLTLATLARLRPPRRAEYRDLLDFHRAVLRHVCG